MAITLDSTATPMAPAWDAQARVVHAARYVEAITRAELVERTGLSRAAVDQAAAALLERGLLIRTALRPSSGGRRPGLLAFNRAAGYVFGVDVGATSINVGLCDLGAVPLACRDEPIDVREGADRVLGRVKALMEDLLANERLGPERILAIGIGLPGPVEFAYGRPVAPPLMPGWDGLDVPSLFAPEFNCRVYVDNDVNVMALGEQWAGAGRGVDNLIVVKIGTGIGAGVISNGRLHRGSDGSAGDIGHIEVDPDGPVCHCGNPGCLEAMAGGAAIARLAMEAATDGRSTFLAERLAAVKNVAAPDVGDAARHGDQAALEIIRSSGRLIGRALSGIVNFFNPATVIITGGVCGLGDLLLAGIREVVYRRSTALSTRGLQIRYSDLRDIGGTIGAAILAIDELFATRGLLGLDSNTAADRQLSPR